MPVVSQPFAAKEAVAKALGTGLWRSGVVFTTSRFCEVRAVNRSSRCMVAHETFESIGGIAPCEHFTEKMACAFCVIETVSQNCERDSEGAATGMLTCDPMSIRDHMSVMSEDTLDVADSIRVDEI